MYGKNHDLFLVWIIYNIYFQKSSFCPILIKLLHFFSFFLQTIVLCFFVQLLFSKKKICLRARYRTLRKLFIQYHQTLKKEHIVFRRIVMFVFLGCLDGILKAIFSYIKLYGNHLNKHFQTTWSVLRLKLFVNFLNYHILNLNFI